MGRIQKRRKTGNKKKQKTKDSQSSSQVKPGSIKRTDSSVGTVKEKKKQSPSAGGKGTPKNSSAAGKKRKNYLDTVTQFLREVMMELKKVTWPSRKQTTGSTVVMIILVTIISLFLGMVDMGLYRIIKIVLQ